MGEDDEPGHVTHVQQEAQDCTRSRDELRGLGERMLCGPRTG